MNMMKNTFGNIFSVTLAGESHGPCLTVIVDGVRPGVPVTKDDIDRALELRRPHGKISTGRVEDDEFEITSGVYNGYTTGTPVCIIIKNKNVRSEDYETGLLRPGHADLSAFMKYHGFEDRRGGGHFSGRITAAVCAAGAIAEKILFEKGIEVISRIKRCGGVSDAETDSFSIDDLRRIKEERFPVISREAGEKMRSSIEKASEEGDSVGGVTQTFITGIPGGVGEPFFDSVESVISHAVFSVPGVKGIEFGGGFGLSDVKGSEANDRIYVDDKGKLQTKTNNSGGINGGVTNGMPVVFSVAVKPTPSVSVAQETVRLTEIGAENVKAGIKGRHDPCIVHRAVHVINAVTCIAVLDLIQTRFGYEI